MTGRHANANEKVERRKEHAPSNLRLMIPGDLQWPLIASERSYFHTRVTSCTRLQATQPLESARTRLGTLDISLFTSSYSDKRVSEVTLVKVASQFSRGNLQYAPIAW